MVSRRAPAVHPFSRAEETAPLGKRLHFRAWLGLALARNNSTRSRETNRKIFVRIDSRPFFLLPFFKNRSISKGSTESWLVRVFARARHWRASYNHCPPKFERSHAYLPVRDKVFRSRISKDANLHPFVGVITPRDVDAARTYGRAKVNTLQFIDTDASKKVRHPTYGLNKCIVAKDGRASRIEGIASVKTIASASGGAKRRIPSISFHDVSDTDSFENDRGRF